MRKMALNKKHKGSTLPEVLIALTITSFCTTLAIVIYLNIQKSTLPFQRIKASELANKYLNQAVEKNEFLDTEFSEENYEIKRIIKHNVTYSDCKDIIVVVFDINKKKLAEVQTTLYVE